MHGQLATSFADAISILALSAIARSLDAVALTLAMDEGKLLTVTVKVTVKTGGIVSRDSEGIRGMGHGLRRG